MILEIHTDGGCAGNQNQENLGGWGAVLKFGVHQKELYGSEKNTTNNRMEMTALLKALESIKKEGQTIFAYSDSAYLMDVFRKKWYANWQKKEGKNASKKPVENQDLWIKLIPFLDVHNITFFRVRGHINPSSLDSSPKYFKEFKKWNGQEKTYEEFENAVFMNNLADSLANKGIDQIR